MPTHVENHTIQRPSHRKAELLRTLQWGGGTGDSLAYAISISPVHSPQIVQPKPTHPHPIKTIPTPVGQSLPHQISGEFQFLLPHTRPIRPRCFVPGPSSIVPPLFCADNTRGSPLSTPPTSLTPWFPSPYLARPSWRHGRGGGG